LPNYNSCGNKGQIRASYFFYRACIWLKRHHLDWGAPFIHLELMERYGAQDIPSVRQMQRWFNNHHLNVPRQRKEKEVVPKIEHAHDRWQVDAKEQLRLADGTPCTYISIVDEYTGSSLGATLFPLRPNQSSAP
jgi:hypothetical protein